MKFRELLEKESNLTNEYILQTLADKDINAKIEKDFVIVHKDDIKQTKKILKSINCEKNVKSGLNESISVINDYRIGYLITYSIYMVAQTHVWHLLCKNGQKHTALGEFYDELQDEVDELAEKFIAQGGNLESISQTISAEYDEYRVVQQIEYYRDYVSEIISSIGVSGEMASIIDGVTDIQEIIDSKLYKFKLE